MKSDSNLGLADILTVVFIVLKLIGVIDWPWLWVLSPLLVSFALFLLILVITLLDEYTHQPHPHRKK